MNPDRLETGVAQKVLEAGTFPAYLWRRNIGRTALADEVLITRRSELLEAEVSGELIGLDVESGTCYGFNPTATRIWALLDTPRTLDQLCDTLTSEFQVDRESCARDVVALLRELEADGLVEISGTLPPPAA
jgi:hypothetical protein